MELNSIRLNPSLVTELYHSSLVAGDETSESAGPATIDETTKEVAAPGLKFLGENKKNILMVVNHSDSMHLPDDELSFLTSILSACQLNLGDVAIVNLHNYPDNNYQTFIAEFKSRVVFLFGVSPTAFGLPIDFPQFQVQPFSKSTFLASPPLHDYSTDNLLKSKLWVCLKRIFVIG
jgi:hypothetical protein